MNRQDLQIAFNRTYQQGEWLGVLSSVLPGADLFSNPQPIEIDHKIARRVAQLGRVRLKGGRQLAVLEIEVGERIDVVRNRVGLRNFVTRFIDLERAHGVLALFLSSEPDYRFTFAAKESVFSHDGTLTTKETAARRFTYILGPNEPCRTPAERFAELAAKAHEASLDDVIAAFSVEKLNKEFFADFCRAFKWVCEDLRSRHDWTEAVIKAEAQTLLNRLLFLYFVQRKGWLNRERTFLVSNFRGYYEAAADSSAFFTEFLQPLFERLSTEDLPGVLPNLAVPFLNGGLLNDEYGDEQYDETTRRHRSLRVRNETFYRIFEDLLERYNFTIHEDSPSHYEVAIDPEMLGRIFEELVLRGEESGSGGKSARHDSGSHYTPRPIVNYLCRESLAGWLESQAPFAGPSPAEVGHGGLRPGEGCEGIPPARQRIDVLLALDASEGIDEETHAKLNGLLNPDEAAALRDKLLELRACDPAVGSGAFPMGLLHEILNVLRLAETRARGQDPVEGDRDWLYDTKKRVIEKVIYGVDIQAHATEICKLRLWLSLMVDHDLGVDPFNCVGRSFRSALKRLEPLPNLDFKIRRANSLRDTIHGEPVRLFGGRHDVSGTEMAVTINRLITAKRDFYAARKAVEKRRTRLDINDCLFQLAEHHLNQLANEVRGLILREGNEELAEMARLKETQREVSGIRAQIRDARRARSAVQTAALERLQSYLEEDQKPTFVWELDFAEVFFRDREHGGRGDSLFPEELTDGRMVKKRGGFDLLLGNPPYVRIQTLKKQSASLAEYYRERYRSARKGNYDLYVCFVERGLELLNEHTGQLAFILPHKFFNAQYGEPLRRLIALPVSLLRHVVHFGDQQIFPGATNYVCLLFLGKAGAKDGCVFVRPGSLKQWLRTFSGTAGTIPTNDIKEMEWNFAVGRGADVFERLKGMPVKLGAMARIFQGLVTGADRVFILERIADAKSGTVRARTRKGREIEIEASLLKPFLLDVPIVSYRGPIGNHWIVFPYDCDGSSVELLSPGELAGDFPKAWAYLRENSDDLKAREGGKWDHSQWYAFGRNQNLSQMDSPKLIVQVLAKSPRFAFDCCGFYFTGGGNGPYYGVRWDLPGEQCSLHLLQAMMNSPVSDFFIRKTSTTFHGDYWSYGKRFIENLPLCILDQAKPVERTRHDAIVRLVEWLLWLNREPTLIETPQEYPRDPLIAAYMEQLVNALVYELYFPKEIHAADLRFFDLVAQHSPPPLSEWEEKAERLRKIRERFDNLHATDHPMRQALYKLGTLDIVRIIEGRA